LFTAQDLQRFGRSCGIIVPAEEKVRKIRGFKGLSRVFWCRVAAGCYE